ncbi:MAG: VWA-like domain-containing protein [Eubacterium sp.]|nr:VWA-like domain-containing protein [Eubacterium sp.]
MAGVTYDKSETVWQEGMGEKILKFTSDELMTEFRFLSFSLNAFAYKPDKRLVTSATDGEYLFYNSEKQIELFKSNPSFLSRLYLHSMLHCLFSHLWTRGGRDEFLWGIASDIAVEYVIDNLKNDRIKRPLSLIRKQVYEEFESENRALSAATVYRYLLSVTSEKSDLIRAEYFVDDHVFWPKEEKLDDRQLMLKNKWQNIASQTQKKKSASGDDADDEAGALSMQIQAGKSKRSYTKFLKEFMVVHEELMTDPDEFDLGFYMYGLSIYKNMPLIEPVETKETKRIQDFAVVVDTSYSTSGELVRAFLRETFQILNNQDSFFRKGRVHLIQADDRVQSDVVIDDESQIERLVESFELKGGGNTDFRPAFEYVGKLVGDGAFENLCGLLYFTDGRGIYPKKEPPFKTAFVYMEPYDESQVPVWAMQIFLDENELGVKK